MFITSVLLAQTAEPIEWAEYGLAGLVIFTLFGLLVMIIKWHREDRREWMIDSRGREDQRSSQQASFIAVQSELTVAVRELTQGQAEAIKMHREIHEDHIRDRAVKDAQHQGLLSHANLPPATG